MSARDAQFRALYRDLRITDQQEFYQSRSEEYADAHRQAITVRYILLLLSAAAGIAGQLVAGTGRAGLSVIAAVLAALAGAVTAYETLIGFPKLKKLYQDAALNLSAARIDWDAIEPDEDATAEMERVETIFRTENGQWGQLVAESAAKGTPAAGKTSIKLRMLAISAVAAWPAVALVRLYELLMTIIRDAQVLAHVTAVHGRVRRDAKPGPN